MPMRASNCMDVTLKLAVDPLNFLTGQAEMTVYASRRRKEGESLDVNAKVVFVHMFNSRLLTDCALWDRTNYWSKRNILLLLKV